MTNPTPTRPEPTTPTREEPFTEDEWRQMRAYVNGRGQLPKFIEDNPGRHTARWLAHFDRLEKQRAKQHLTSEPAASVVAPTASLTTAAEFVRHWVCDGTDEEMAPAIEALTTFSAQVRRDAFDEVEDSLRMFIALFPDKTTPVDRAYRLGTDGALKVVQRIRALSPSPVKAGALQPAASVPVTREQVTKRSKSILSELVLMGGMGIAVERIADCEKIINDAILSLLQSAAVPASPAEPLEAIEKCQHIQGFPCDFCGQVMSDYAAAELRKKRALQDKTS